MSRDIPTYQPENAHEILRYCLSAFLLCLCSSVIAFDAEDYLWQSRLLLIAAASHDDPEVVNVRDFLLQRTDAVKDRDLVVIQLYETAAGMIDDKQITNEESRRIRAYYGLAADDKAIVLIGKDGEIKRRSPLTVDLASIFDQIDAMPMRQQEIRDKAASNQQVPPARR